MTIKTINPATEEIIQEYETITKEEVVNKTKKAKDAFYEWKKDSSKRINLLHEFAQQLLKDKENLAKTVTTEMGKAIEEAGSEVEKCCMG